MKYADLRIELRRRRADEYALECVYSDSAGAEVRHEVGGAAPMGFLPSDMQSQWADPHEYGRLLSDALFADAGVRDLFASAVQAAASLRDPDRPGDGPGCPLRVSLSFDRELISLHDLQWEAMLDPGDGAFLATKSSVVFSRFLSSPFYRPLPPRRPGEKLRLVLAVSNPEDAAAWGLTRTDTAEEVARVRRALDPAVYEVRELAGSGQATLAGVVAAADGCDVLHFVGHGRRVHGGADPRVWFVHPDNRSDSIPGHALSARLAELPTPPRLVVLSACHHAAARAEDTTGLAGLAPRLVEAGIPAVVAASAPITDATAEAFGASFYRELTRGGRIDEAVAAARRSVRDRPDALALALYTRLRGGNLWVAPQPSADEPTRPPDPPPAANPFVGPRSLRRGEPIHGRGGELYRLKSLLVAERAVLLYSPSGAGKTSLVQAGLVPALAADEFRVLRPIRLNRGPAAGDPKNRYTFSALLSLEAPADENGEPPPGPPEPPARLLGESLSDYLKRRWPGDADTVLVFDQFEELLTLDPVDVDAKREFLRQVGAVLDGRQWWALFAMREDYIAALDPYQQLLPGQLRARFRLDLLGREAAREAIQKSAGTAITFTAAAADRLAADLSRVRVQLPDGTLDDAQGLYVEPVQLQVICRRLWDAPRPDPRTVTEADVEKAGGVDTALADYYSGEVQAAVARSDPGPGRVIVGERALRDWIEARLITPQALRGQASSADLARDRVDGGAVRYLIDTAHLLREDRARGASWYELTHDRLVRPIRAANARWRLDRLHAAQRQADEWVAQGRPPGLLLKGPALAEAERWVRGHDSELTEADRAFLEECRDRNSWQAARGVSLAEVGWGVVFAHDADPALRECLSELLDHRRRQASRDHEYLYQEFTGAAGYRPGESVRDFLIRHGAGSGLPDWAKMPYFLLLVGDPVAIPFEFQYGLAERHAVGRLHFDTPDEYASYARSVVTTERPEFNLPPRSAFFGTRHPADRPTKLGYEVLFTPLVGRLRQDQAGWTIQEDGADRATKARLGELLGGPDTPVFLFNFSHGMWSPPDNPGQEAVQGAIVCQDWLGFGTVREPHYFAAADVPAAARLLGLVAFLFTSHGAGCTASDDFFHTLHPPEPARQAPRTFIARLPQRLLGHPNGGALAVIGHVDRVWGASFFMPGGKDPDIQAFVASANRLLGGFSVGEAMQFFSQRHARFTSDLARAMEQVVFFGQARDDYELARLRTEAVDARNWVILGDPAVRLPIGKAAESVDRPVIDPVPPRPPFKVVPPPTPPPPPVAETPTVPATTATTEEPAARVVVANGIDGETGGPLLPPVTLAELSRAIRGLQRKHDASSEVRQTDWWRDRQAEADF